MINDFRPPANNDGVIFQSTAVQVVRSRIGRRLYVRTTYFSKHESIRLYAYIKIYAYSGMGELMYKLKHQLNGKKSYVDFVVTTIQIAQMTFRLQREN